MRPVDAAEAARTLQAVRWHQPLAWWSLAAALLLAAACWFWPTAESTLERFMQGFARGCSYGWIGGSIILLSQRRMFFFDAQRRRVIDPRSRRDRYPSRGFERLEYSVYDGRIYQVARDGARKKLPFKRFWANREDWRTLVDLLLQDEPKQGFREEG
ncbi:hypothetical protein [Glycomyces albidus]|uniref:Uncharacterized protein n=1 Tax=Glycomyces albidus TaxID=2656774 RepID=A0A6L5G691_9ACTN|nr:hypothetical protein [Glycomyces albidus]MQM25143.1 hypothetical protein [Glycomyces albidus]